MQIASSDKGLIFKICEDLTQLCRKTTNSQIKKRAEDVKRHFPKKRHTGDQQALEKVPNITGRQGNADPSHRETPSRTRDGFEPESR